jgi:N-acetylglucosamine-6-phosphate deacetylase
MHSIPTIQGTHGITGKPIEIRFEQGKIEQIKPLAGPSTVSSSILPPLIDLQVNGYGGVDFQQDGLTLEQMEHASLTLVRDGCAGYFATLITCPWEQMLSRLQHLKQLRQSSSVLSRHLLGWHLEGPFLSEEPGFSGAHDACCMLDPTIEHLLAIKAITQDDPCLLTLAPERPGSMPFIQEAQKLGIKVSLGHTNASNTTLNEAHIAGATGFTHLGNACPQALDRHDNILLRALDPACWITGLIPDGIHVSPGLFRLLHRCIPSGQIYYTTDAMAAAGSPPGRYPLGNIELEVGADQIVRHPGRSHFAGSALKPVEGIQRASRMLGCHWSQLWKHVSTIPSEWMGLNLGLAIGAKALCTLASEGSDGNLKLEVIAA